MTPDPSERTTRVQFLRFVIAAGLSVPVNILARILLSRVMPYEVAIVISHLVGMATAYLLTKLFVFAASGRSVTSEFSRFALVNAVSVAQTWVVSVVLVRFVFPSIGFDESPELVAHVIGLATSSVVSYWGHRRFSFGSRS